VNFLTAIKHAAIGYGIARKGWGDEGVCLYLDDCSDLRWTHNEQPCRLMGPSETLDLTKEDIQAKDWETI
jgi:hypothetical protein